MNDPIPKMRVELDRIRMQLAQAERDLHAYEGTLSELHAKATRLKARKTLTAVADWNASISHNDEGWKWAFPLAFCGITFPIVLFSVTWLLSSVMFAMLIWAAVVAIVLSFFFYSTSPLAKSAPTATDLNTQWHDLESDRDATRKHVERWSQKCRTLRLDRDNLEIEIRSVQESAQYQSRAKISTLLYSDWKSLRGIPWEEFLAALLRYNGYSVETTKASGDQGVDLIVERGGVFTAVQAKGYAGSVGNDAVQQAFTGMSYYDCHRCAVITNSEFTPSAIQAADKVGCILVSAKDLIEFAEGRLPKFHQRGITK